MKEKILRFTALSFSVLLLAVSAGVIVWIGRDESSRLAAREKAAIEAAEKASAEEKALEAEAESADSQDSAKLLHDIDTLLSSLASDDLPDDN